MSMARAPEAEQTGEAAVPAVRPSAFVDQRPRLLERTLGGAARAFSPGGGVAFLTVVVGWWLGAFGHFFSEQAWGREWAHSWPLRAQLLCWLAVSLAFLARLGFLRRLGLRAVEAADARTVNDGCVGLDIRSGLDPDRLRALLAAAERFPRLAFLHSLFLGTMLLLGVFAYLGWRGGLEGLPDAFVPSFVFQLAIVTITAAACEVIAELATARARFTVRRELHRVGRPPAPPEPRSSLGAKLGLVLFVACCGLALGILVARPETVIDAPWLYFGPAVAMLAMIAVMLRLTLTIIRRDMLEVRVAVADLAAGGSGTLHTGSLDREMIDLAGSLSTLGMSAREARAALESRTRDLAALNETLERRVEQRAGAILAFSEDLEAINALSADIAETMETRRIVDLVVERLPPLLRARNCSVFLHDEEERVLRMVAHNLENVPHDPAPVVALDADNITARCFKAGRSFFVRDIEAEMGLPKKDRYRSGSFMSLLMRRGDRKVGIVHLSDKIDADAFDEDDLRLAKTFADHLAAAITNAKLFDLAREEANTDSLTGLATRRFFDQRLEQEVQRAQRFGRPFSVAIVDVDDLKLVNDVRGHLAGDALLRWVSDEVRASTRGIDAVARFGGDEIAVLLVETPIAGAKIYADRVLSAIGGGAVPWHDGPFKATVSIGLAEWTAGATREMLLEAADRATYQVKREGKNGVAVA